MRSLVLAIGLLVISVPQAFAQSSDTTAPLLTSFSFTPSVDVSTSPQIVTVNATITDDLAGFFFGLAQFTSPNNQLVSGSFFRTSGNALNGVYQANVMVPRFVQAGIWKAQVFLQDNAGNRRTLAASTLQTLGFPTDLTVINSNQDTLPPTLISASFSPGAIDVSSNDVNVTVTLQITDNLSGTDFSRFIDFSVVLMPPTPSTVTARQYISSGSFSLVAGTPNNGTWQAVKKMPRYSPSGPWRLQSVSLRDAATNQIFLNSAQLVAAGINPTLTVNSLPSDVSNPALTGLSFSPSLFNTSLGSQTVTITLSASDDLSGVDFSPTTPNLAFAQFVLTSPSGGQNVIVNPFIAPTLVGGNSLAGTWQMTALWPQFSEEGTWRVSTFVVKDAVANQVMYTQSMLVAMGLPNTIVVTKPSQVVDGQVGSGGGTVIDNSFGNRASVTFPPGIAPNATNVAIDVFANPLAVPTPRGFTMPGTYFVNIAFTPALSSPLPAPGITVVLPLLTPMTPGAQLSLYHIDPISGNLAPAINAFHQAVVGTVNADSVSATFLNVVTLSTVVAYLSNGSVVGDVDGNGTVSCADVSLVRASFGKRVGQAGFNSAADLNNDTIVDIKDLILITRQLPAGTSCT
jgi:hypothetical protein